MTEEQKEEAVEGLNQGSKLVDIGGETIRVYPRHCVADDNCLQCKLTGKLPCEPRHRVAPTLTKEQKVAIAQDAKNRGIKLVARENSIPMHIVRGWVAAYTRGNKLKDQRHSNNDVTCLLCGRKLRPARRVSMPDSQYCSKCTTHVLPSLRQGQCPECRDPLDFDQDMQELVCHNCMLRWPAIDEAAAQMATTQPSNEHNGLIPTLEQRIEALTGKLSELQQQNEQVQSEINRCNVLLQSYMAVYNAEQNGGPGG